MILALSGTPGTGKKTVAKSLAKKLSYKVIELSKFIDGVENSEKEVSIGELNEIANKVLQPDSIVVSHLSHFLVSKSIKYFIILRCDPLVLEKRLKKRGYSNEKIYDNVIFEAIDGTYIEAADLHKKVIQLDNTKNLSDTVNSILSLVRSGKMPKPFKKDYSKYIVKIEKDLK